MVKRTNRILVVGLIVTSLLVPTYLTLVSSASGLIRINTKFSSASGQSVEAGGNLNLYFGDVSWSGTQFYLVLSADNNFQISTGDLVYTPRFSISNLTSPATNVYTNGNGAWSVGNNWINGSVAPNIPIGNYYIKAFDEVSASVAISDVSFRVYSVIYSASLQANPSSGPGGIPVEFTGSGFPPSSNVAIAYLDPAFGSWNPLTTVTANSQGKISFTSEMPDLRRSVGSGDYPEAYTQVSYRAEINGVVYCYVDYNQYSRGLKTIGTQTANGLYGNGTNLSTNTNVKPGDTIDITGKYFHPGVIYIRWDGTQVVGTVTGNQWKNAQILGTTVANNQGTFQTTITIPDCNTGEHYVSVEDSETKVIIKIAVSSSTHHPDETPTPSSTPTPAIPRETSHIDLSCSSTTTYIGFKVEISGQLSTSHAPINGESIVILYSIDGGNFWTGLTSVTTDEDGNFSALWMPAVSGNYQIKAQYSGNDETEPSSQTVNLVAAPFEDKNVFSVASNSTITMFAFNSTRNELTFTVSGPTGTMGSVDVTIAKSLIAEITDLKVYMDGENLPYTSESTIDSWILHFTYNHSTHSVIVDLGKNTEIPNQATNPTQTPTKSNKPPSSYSPSPEPDNTTALTAIDAYIIPILAVIALIGTVLLAIARKRRNNP